MDWMEEAAVRLKKRREILFSKDSVYLQDLRSLLREQNHKVLTLWALDLAAESAAALKEKYPQERRPEEVLAAAWDWASGRIKMREAQRKILDCHAFAKELEQKEDIALCHAIGQACAVVHAPGHAMGYPIYDLTAILRRLGIEHAAGAVEQRKQDYIDRLFYWADRSGDPQRRWASFFEQQP